MSFDEQPDGDPHGECAAEIARLEAELAAARNDRLGADLLACDRIRSLEAELAVEKMQHSVTIADEHESRSEFQDRIRELEALIDEPDDLEERIRSLEARIATLTAEVMHYTAGTPHPELALRQTAEAYAARNALRVIALQDALRKIVRDGDYTAPEGMKRIAQEALATELETLVDLKDPHNAHHPDRLKGPGLTAPETKGEQGG